jgi:hypothetical protein
MRTALLQIGSKPRPSTASSAATCETVQTISTANSGSSRFIHHLARKISRD